MTRITNIPNLEGYGVFVDDIDFKTMSRQEWIDLGKLHMQKLVMIIRKTGLEKPSFLQVMRKWGQDRQNYAATLFAKYPWAEGNVVKLLRSPKLEQQDRDTIREFFRVGGGNLKTGNAIRVSGKKLNGKRIGMFADGESL